MEKPMNKSIEEWKAGLVAIAEKGANGTTAKDIYDVVSKPKHYMLFDPEEAKTFAYLMTGIEVRDVIEKLVRKVQYSQLASVPHYTKGAALFESDYVQLMQYLMRFMDKNGKEDLEKGRFYLDKMIDSY
jgi:hypothetical protein